MQKVSSIETARARKEMLQTRQLYNASPFHSPVPLLIELLEPILDEIREKPGANVQTNLNEYLDVLELSRREIDQLEDMAQFLLSINRADC